MFETAVKHELREVNLLCYLDLLEVAGCLTEVLGHIETLSSVDLGVDQPLLEFSESRTEALVQQLLLALAPSGGLEVQAGNNKLHSLSS